MKVNFYGRFFNITRWIIGRFYPTYSIHIEKNVDEPVVYISHHQNMFGPFVILLWFPISLRAWILHAFLNQHACYRQYVDYTFTKRFKLPKWLAKLCAYPLSHTISKLLNSGKGIPVYRGTRKIVETFHQTVTSLRNGENIVIFPDIDYKNNEADTKEMYDGFLSLEKYYFKATGKHICFIPLFVSKKQKMIIGDSKFYFRDGEDFQAERKVVYEKIHNNLNNLAKKCGDLR